MVDHGYSHEILKGDYPNKLNKCNSTDKITTSEKYEARLFINFLNVSEVARSYNSSLPPVNPECNAIVVIPVYREFRSGRIVDTLHELHSQSIDPGKYEIVLVINNPVLGDDKFGMEARSDNLKLIHYIKKEQTDGKLLNVRVIDCTNGQLPQRHMGMARGLGNEIAALRFQDTSSGDDGIIVQLDADVSVDADFLQKMIEQYRNDPSLESALIGKIPLPVHYVSDSYYLGMATEFMVNVSNLLKTGTVYGSGPTISFRARLQRNPQVRTYMQLGQNEDTLQGILLPKNSKFRILAEPRAFISDRERPEGFDANIRSSFIEHRLGWDTFHELLQVISQRALSSHQITINEAEFQSLKPLELQVRILAIMEELDPKTAGKLKSYLSRETEMAYSRLDPAKVDNGKIVLGSLAFSLSRIILDIIK